MSACATCLLAVLVCNTEMVDGHGEGQVEMGHADGLGVVKDECEAWTEGPRQLEN